MTALCSVHVPNSIYMCILFVIRLHMHRGSIYRAKNDQPHQTDHYTSRVQKVHLSSMLSRHPPRASSCHLASSCTSSMALVPVQGTIYRGGYLLHFQDVPYRFRLRGEDLYLTKRPRRPTPLGRTCAPALSVTQAFPYEEVSLAPPHLCTQRLLYHFRFGARPLRDLDRFICFLKDFSLSKRGDCSAGSSFSLSSSPAEVSPLP